MEKFYSKCLYLLVLLFLSSGISQAQVSSLAFTSNTGTYTEITGGTLVATATAQTGPGSLDDIIYNVPNGTIPFNFSFNGQNFTGLNISTNGFITFGATPPAAVNSGGGYTPLSATTGYHGAVSALGRNLNSFYNSSNPAQTGNIRYQALGSAPNRVFVIQWQNFKMFNTGANNFTQVLNFQIRLTENHAVEIVYNCSGTIGLNTYQVGLRGQNNSFPLNINNRSIVTGQQTWTTSVPGTSNISTCDLSGSNLPPSGLTYRWAAPPCPAPALLSFNNATQTSANLYWRSSGGNGTFEIEYGPAGFTPGTGITTTSTDTFKLITGLTAATSYQYYVRQNCSSSGNGFSSISGPRNFATGTIGEDCLSAITLNVASGPGSCSPVLINSGVSQNGPNSLCSDNVSGNFPDDDTWMKFTTPSGNKRLRIQTTAGTANDWVMEVWNGCPASGGLMIRCSDDVNMYMPEVVLCQNEYTAGQVFYVRAWTYASGLSGTMSICVFQDSVCVFPPVNDECADAISLPINLPMTCPGNNQEFTTLHATQSGAPTIACDNIYRDVWFKFNTGNSGPFNITFSNVTAGNLKAAIIFECGGFEVQCFNPASGTFAVNGLNPVADYILRVWSDTLQAGTFNVCLADQCDDPTANISGSVSMCSGGSAQLKVDLTGLPPWNFVYTNGSQNFSVNTSVTPYFITVNPTVTTFYNLVSVNSQYCAGTTSGSATVSIIQPPVVTLAPFNPVCSNQTISLSGGSPMGGIFSGPGVSGGQFNASVAGPGTHTITYTYGIGSGCQRSATQPITVNQSPVISSFSPVSGPVGSQVTLTGTAFSNVTSVRFNTTTTLTFNIVNANTITVNVPTGATTGYITVFSSNGCSSTSMVTFGVGAPPTNVILSLKIFIQGYYLGGGMMSSVLDPVNLPNICDSVTVNLVPASSTQTVAASKSGTITISGTGNFIFPNTIANNSYYIVVKHRNSIETWSKNPVFIAPGTTTFDFTTP